MYVYLYIYISHQLQEDHMFIAFIDIVLMAVPWYHSLEASYAQKHSEHPVLSRIGPPHRSLWPGAVGAWCFWALPTCPRALPTCPRGWRSRFCS